MIHVEYDITEDCSFLIIDGEKVGPMSVKAGNTIHQFLEKVEELTEAIERTNNVKQAEEND